MAYKQTPVDTFTGLPYPIITGPKLDTLTGVNVVNKNHAFFPRLDPLLQGVGGLALRTCRLQLVEAEYHNFGPRSYHNFYDGPPIPQTEAEQFRTIIFALGGFIPKMGIDLTGPEPVEREMTRREYRRHKTLTENGGYKYFTHGESQSILFLREVILHNAIDVDLELLEKFVASDSVSTRKNIGHTILEVAAENAALGIDADYQAVLSSGELKPRAPERPVSFMRRVIKNQRRVERIMFDRLHSVAALALEAA